MTQGEKQVVVNIIIIAMVIVCSIVLQKKKISGESTWKSLIFVGIALGIELVYMIFTFVIRASGIVMILGGLKWMITRACFVLALAMAYKAVQGEGLMNALGRAGIAIHIIAGILLLVGVILAVVNAKITMISIDAMRQLVEDGGMEYIALLSAGMPSDRIMKANYLLMNLISIAMNAMYMIRYMILAISENKK